MPRRPAIETVNLVVRVPHGRAGFWSIIRELDACGPWSIPAVAARTNDHRACVRDYVRGLVRAGVALATERRGQAQYYRLAARPGAAPSVRRDGTVLPLPATQRMWNAMRGQPQWSVTELAFTAADDDGPVPAATAERYVAHLERAGYLTLVAPAKPGRGGTQAVYRLRRAMNTGPLAPQILRVKAVLDRNRGEVMGAPVAEEAA